MTSINYLEKLETIKYLSQYRKTGTVEKLVEKLNSSQRNIQHMVQQLRINGYPIIYNRYCNDHQVKKILDNFKNNFSSRQS